MYDERKGKGEVIKLYYNLKDKWYLEKMYNEKKGRGKFCNSNLKIKGMIF